MIQYYIKPLTILNKLFYKLLPQRTDEDMSMAPEDAVYNKLEHSYNDFKMSTGGDVIAHKFNGFVRTRFWNLQSQFEIKEIKFDFSDYNRAFAFVAPKTEDDYSFVIARNATQRYALIYKGFSRSRYTLKQGDTDRDVNFVIMRTAPGEVLFMADTEGWTYEIYWDNVTNNRPLNSPSRFFQNIPDVSVISILNPTISYRFRVRGKDSLGNYTEWSTENLYHDGVFIMPLYDAEQADEYFPELERIVLSGNSFSVLIYPGLSSDLGMVCLKHSAGIELRKSEIEDIYSTSPDDPMPTTTKSEIQIERVNNDSDLYDAFKSELMNETDLNLRHQIIENYKNQE